MPVIRSFRELQVYRRSVRASKQLFFLTKAFPPDERYSLTDQVRRSSRAVGSMVAEAWARRRYPASLISKLTDALGEAMETQAWLDHALTCGYLSKAEWSTHDAEWQEVGAMLNGMIDKSETFCDPVRR